MKDKSVGIYLCLDSIGCPWPLQTVESIPRAPATSRFALKASFCVADLDNATNKCTTTNRTLTEPPRYRYVQSIDGLVGYCKQCLRPYDVISTLTRAGPTILPFIVAKMFPIRQFLFIAIATPRGFRTYGMMDLTALFILRQPVGLFHCHDKTEDSNNGTKNNNNYYHKSINDHHNPSTISTINQVINSNSFPITSPT